jgi:hypothetical protein
MLQKHTWVCSLCGQGLTRKSSANRHNYNLHAGQASVVRPYEYIIGRLNGRFHTPKDPLAYRRREENALFHPNLNGNNNDFTSKVIADSMSDRLSQENIIPQQPPKTDNVSSNDKNAFPNLLTQPTRKAGDNKLPSSVDPSEKTLEPKSKFEEFEILLNRYYQPENASQISALVTFLVNQGDENLLDKKLEWLRRLNRIRSGSYYLSEVKT